MYPVSTEFMEKMKSDRRRVLARVEVDYTDPFMDQSIEVQASEQANVSYPAQTADAVLEPFAKIPSLDGSWVLDGSFALAPGPEEANTHQMGWWGSQLSQVDGTFVQPYPTLTVVHFARPIHSLRVVGDSIRDEHPVDFRIDLYDSDDMLLYTENVSSNTEMIWSKPLPSPVLNVARQVLTITKWSRPGRQAKILEFFTSIQETYEGDDIISIHLLEEREVSQGSLPVGTISANEIEIRLNNETRKFDAGNKQSPLYQTLRVNRRIKAWLGVDTAEGKEYVPLGTFWSGDWRVPEDEVYAETIGRDRLELLRKSTYSTSEVLIGEPYTNLFGLAGNCDDLSYWRDGVSDISLYSNDKLFGNYAIRLTTEKTSGHVQVRANYAPFPLKSDKYYFLSGYMRLLQASSNSIDIQIRREDSLGTTITSTSPTTSTTWVRRGKKFKPNYDTNGVIQIGKLNVSAGIDALYDGIMVVEISQEEYENLSEEELMTKYQFVAETGVIPPTLYDLAKNILTDAGLTEEEYYIDTELQQFPVPYAWFDSQSHREALRKVAEACLGQVYCDRNGIIRIEGPSFLQSQSEPVATITQDDYFRKDNPVKWSEIANYVEVETQPLRPDIAQEVYRSNEPISITAGQTKTITAYYNHTPCIEATATLENAVSGAEITKATYYAWGADITVTSTNTGTFELIINAKPLKVLNKEKAIAKDDASITDNGMLKYAFPANPLVQTREAAQKIADALLAYFKNPKRVVEIEWRGNPALLLGDRIAVVDKDETNEYYVTRQELEFDGALRARLNGRRA